MSRFNAQAQKGYYKTPTHLLPVISRYVSCSDPENARSWTHARAKERPSSTLALASDSQHPGSTPMNWMSRELSPARSAVWYRSAAMPYMSWTHLLEDFSLSF